MSGTTEILSYITALGLAAAIPGPGMTALVARSVSGGAITGFTMLAGLILGDLIYLSVAVFGLAVIAHTYTSLFTLINWAASLFLCLLAWQFWCHQPQAINIDQKATKRELASAWFSGLTITLETLKPSLSIWLYCLWLSLSIMYLFRCGEDCLFRLPC